MNLQKFLSVVGSVEIDLSAAGFVGVKHAQRRCVDVNGNEVSFAHVRIAKLVNVGNI